ncbi:hypothetical protein APHCRT_0969 [Anaplasma phagocytophilum str. CRT53-1]|uniref:Uncharacterized protein n=1 Tax=Anaplasma phagocytophilum str. CRT53-1 TaxID=1359157 RepID=A0A0F3PZ97_ANAPH|nr:hypothetical protein APHCRT_0969 [Anaplasma phagocytophilum str. CRT53-1]
MFYSCSVLYSLPESYEKIYSFSFINILALLISLCSIYFVPCGSEFFNSSMVSVIFLLPEAVTNIFS